jgi:transposase-like protein
MESCQNQLDIPQRSANEPSGWFLIIKVRRAEVDSGRRDGVTSDERTRIKELERENRELRRANEILRKASAYFAQAELDRRPKR